MKQEQQTILPDGYQRWGRIFGIATGILCICHFYFFAIRGLKDEMLYEGGMAAMLLMLVACDLCMIFSNTVRTGSKFSWLFGLVLASFSLVYMVLRLFNVI